MPLSARLRRNWAVPTGEVDKAWAKLLEMGLLRMDGDEALIAVNPMLAEAMVLGAEELELSARRASVEGRRDAIRQLVPDWNTALTPTVLTSAVEVISDQAATGNVLMHYAESCQSELLSVAPGRLPRTRVDHRTRVANLYSLRRGINTRALYQHAALRDRHTRAYLTELAANGGEDPFCPIGTGTQSGGRPHGGTAADPHRRSRPARPSGRP